MPRSARDGRLKSNYRILRGLRFRVTPVIDRSAYGLAGGKLGLRKSFHYRRPVVWKGNKHGARAMRFALDLSREELARLKRGRMVRVYGGGSTFVLRMKNGTIVLGRAGPAMAGSYRMSRRGGLKDEEPEEF